MIRNTPKGIDVWSRDGKRHLGGPHATRKEANERLRQVEAAKAAKAPGKPAPAREGGISGLIRRAGEASGASAIARGVVGSVDAGIARMVQLARDEGISEAKIQKALRAQKALERYQSMVALLLPFIPSPKLMRLLAKK